MERTNEIGTIKINKSVFGKLVIDAVMATEGKAFIASSKAKIIAALGGGRPSIGEVTDNIRTTFSEDGVVLEFDIIMSFGASIQKNTDLMLNALEEALKSMFPDQPGVVRIKIVGVKSRKIALRDIEVERRWN